MFLSPAIPALVSLVPAPAAATVLSAPEASVPAPQVAFAAVVVVAILAFVTSKLFAATT